MFRLYVLVMGVSAFTLQPAAHTGRSQEKKRHGCGPRTVLCGFCQPCRRTLAPTSALLEMLLTVTKCPLSSECLRIQMLPCRSSHTRKFYPCQPLGY
uniref:Interleukin 1 receptor type 2 n=1 Tax=Pan troglodytes TaxID=9598 RepID=A0A2I3T0M9_PANTR